MKRIFFLLLAFIIIFSCDKSENNDELKESVENTNRIFNDAELILENILSEAYSEGTLVDPEIILQEISQINGVKSAVVNSLATGITVEQNDGASIDIILVARDDERMFTEIEKKENLYSIKNVKSGLENLVIPNGEGKALILAPFQWSFNEDLNLIENLLEVAGYSVDIFENEDASLDLFRSSYLDNYDIVYFSTHGYYGRTRYGEKKPSLFLVTGEKFNYPTLNDLDEKYFIGSAKIPNSSDSYFSISVYWLEETSDNSFPNSWIFANACESAAEVPKQQKLSQAFLDLGAMGYNGWQYEIFNPIAKNSALEMFEEFTSGLSFSAASEKVRENYLSSYGLRIRLHPFDVGTFVNNQYGNEPFYLFESDDIPNDGLVAYYPFNGNAADGSGNGNNGTVHGPTLTTDRFGNTNSAYLFDGDDDFIEINHSSSLNISQNISISFWAKFETSGPFYYPYHIIEKYGSWGMGQREDDIAFGVTTDNGEVNVWALNFDYDQWYHFVMKYDGSNISIHVNGQLYASEAANGSINTTTNKLYISRYNAGGNYYFDGTLDDFRIYNRALNNSELIQLYQEGE